LLHFFAEIQSFYERGWKDMSKRFFATSSWPTTKEISSLVKDDKAFLVLYRLLFYRHVLATLNTSETPSTFAHYVQAWDAYRAFFEFCIDTSKPSASASEGQHSGKEQPLPAVWVYDIMGDCVYLYQQFTDARANAASGSGRSMAMGATTEEEVAAAWTLPEVLSLLHRTVEKSNIVSLLNNGQSPQGFRPLAGYFSLVCLSRFYTKLGDYGAALEALKPLRIFAADGTVFARIPKAHIFVQYYASFALLMARRYEDAFRVLNRTLATFQRMQNVFGEREGGERGATLIQKNADKMLALLALCVSVIPNTSIGSVDDALRRPLREKYGETIEKLTSGDAGEVENVFDKAAPGYFTWSSSTPSKASSEPTPAEAAASAATSAADAVMNEDSPVATFNFHLSQLQKDIAQRTGGLGGLRAFLRLYTSIDVKKLAQTSGMTEGDVR
jgi:translation initiation factor 3 subunit L